MTKKELNKKSISFIKENGFSLVELMIAMVISLFLSLAIFGIFIVINNNFFSSKGIIGSQENKLSLIRTLSNSIESAGYFVDPLNENRAFVFDANVKFQRQGQIIYGEDVDGNSVLNVRYQTAPNDLIFNCLGIENTSNQRSIFTDSYYLNKNNEIICSSAQDGVEIAETIFAENVSSFKLMYATDTNSDGMVDGYLTASQVENYGWHNVYGVIISLEFFDEINRSGLNKKIIPYETIHFVNLMNMYEKSK